MFVNQKTQEISYALTRIAPYIRRVELRQRLEKYAFQLLENVGMQNFEDALKSIVVLESLISLGKLMYEIEPVNAKIIIGELRSVKESLEQITGIESESQNTSDVAPIFSKVPTIISDDLAKKENGNSAPMVAIDGNGNGMASTIRQSAILDKIRQSENRQAQLKDIIAAFPEVSERTMRYDLQKLCLQGLIERIGNGGPGSYYALKG